MLFISYLIAFIGGMFFGVLLIALVSANEDKKGGDRNG